MRGPNNATVPSPIPEVLAQALAPYATQAPPLAGHAARSRAAERHPAVGTAKDARTGAMASP
ncbi:hypothetical protein DSC45_35425 [Streptomyces sp. YIM 130001]|nr:hypothetical protein DSC45_35425 [Streptomyces sp. YIM 130001]